jgi:ABC-type Fe3+-hydroxamate transport system substrate-binding protein
MCPRPRREPRASPLPSRPVRTGRDLSTALIISMAWVQGCGTEAGEPGGNTGEDDSPTTAEITLVDAEGVEHHLASPANRIVSLVPSATNTLHALGADDVLVGRTDYDTATWAATIPSVGGGLDPNLEALVALRPDLVIRFGGEQDPRTPVRLDELGIPHVAVRPVRLADIYRTTEILGQVAGHEALADSLTEAIRQGLSRLRERVGPLPPVRVAYLLGGSPPWAAGPDTFIGEILELAGGVNVFDDLPASYASVSLEELRTRDIDVVLVSGDGGWDRVLDPDVRVEAIGAELENPGPGVVEAAWRVAEVLHGMSLH